MNKLTVLSLTLSVLLSAMSSTQNVFARNPAKDALTSSQHHSGNGNALLLGEYTTICLSGNAVADTRNISNNGHNKQVVHLLAQYRSQAITFLNNLDTVPTILKTPVGFTVEKGDARLLLVVFQYVPPGKTSEDSITLYLVTPDTNFVFPGLPLTTLVSEGNGKYSIPFGNHGVPQGSQLTFLSFSQLGTNSDCSIHASDIGELQINRRFVGIAADPSSTCDLTCGGGG